MINIFFDCEFTKLQEGFDPELSEMISIGCISQDGKTFYAENATTLARPEHFSEFVINTAVPLLEGGVHQMPYADIARTLKVWIESFDKTLHIHDLDGGGDVMEDEFAGKNVKLRTDAARFDWPHVEHMFDNYGWPRNLVRKPIALSFPSSNQQMQFSAAVEDVFEIYQPALRRHHALDDAIANKFAFERAIARRY